MTKENDTYWIATEWKSVRCRLPVKVSSDTPTQAPRSTFKFTHSYNMRVCVRTQPPTYTLTLIQRHTFPHVHVFVAEIVCVIWMTHGSHHWPETLLRHSWLTWKSTPVAIDQLCSQLCPGWGVLVCRVNIATNKQMPAMTDMKLVETKSPSIPCLSLPCLLEINIKQLCLLLL